MRRGRYGADREVDLTEEEYEHHPEGEDREHRRLKDEVGQVPDDEEVVVRELEPDRNHDEADEHAATFRGRGSRAEESRADPGGVSVLIAVPRSRQTASDPVIAAITDAQAHRGGVEHPGVRAEAEHGDAVGELEDVDHVVGDEHQPRCRGREAFG